MPDVTVKRSTALFVNSEPVLSAAGTLAGLVEERGHVPAQVATALNGDFVSVRARVTTVLQDGDRVEIVSARHGG